MWPGSCGAYCVCATTSVEASARLWGSDRGSPSLGPTGQNLFLPPFLLRNRIGPEPYLALLQAQAKRLQERQLKERLQLRMESQQPNPNPPILLLQLPWIAVPNQQFQLKQCVVFIFGCCSR